MHEIITLQLGQQSNYLATHFWNAQESYFTYAEDEESAVDHDVHWRPGIGADGNETYMPRTVIYDLKGGFGSLKKINALYEIEDASTDHASSSSLWGGPTVVQRQDPIQPSAYQQSLDAGLEPARPTTDSVRYWSDFSRVFYHPRSVVQLNDYELHSSIAPFESWDAGGELFAGLDRDQDIADRDLRPFAEEADQMQAIQVFTTLDDAWGGFASRYVERLRDEYGKTPVWVWGLQSGWQGVNREKRLLRLVNKAKSLSELYKQASLVIPIALPPSLPARLRRVLSLDAASQWHTSALLSAAVESATLPSRLRDPANRETLGHMADRLNVHGRQTVASLQMSFAAAGKDAPPPRAEETGDEDGGRTGVRLDLDFRPADDLGEASGLARNGVSRSEPRMFSQVLASRGVEQPDQDEGHDEDDDRMRRRTRGPREPAGRSYRTALRYPLLDSFPQIFRDEEGGALTDNIAVTTSLSTDTALSARLKALRTTVTRLVGVEERETLGNDLAEMADEYHEGWSSGSDFGDDD